MDKNGDDKMTTDLVPISGAVPALNKSANRQAIIRSKTYSAGYVPHLDLAAVSTIADIAGEHPRLGERNKLLIQTLFDGCLRITEALRTRPRDIKQSGAGWYIEVFGKGSKPGVVAISASLAAQLQAYAYRHKIKPDERLFPFTRARAFQIVDAAMEKSGIAKPDHVGTVHVLRHSGALERLKITGNPRAVQDQLRHADARMTLRYMKTLSSEESIRIQQSVDFQW